MHFLAPGCLRSVRAIAVVALLAACSGSVDQGRFPADESEFAKPVSRPFKMTEPIPIEWEVYDPKSLKPLPVKKFNFNSLPTKPFNIGYPFPLKAPPEQRSIDWKSLPDTVFDMASLPTQPLRFKTMVIPPPAVTKAGLPVVRLGTSRGVMDAGTGLGLPGNGRTFINDASGLLWIATDKGLCRYDGVNLEVYGLEHGINELRIWSLEEDSRHRIWMGTQTGEVFVLDRKAGLMHKLIDNFPQGQAFDIEMDHEGQIWITRARFGVIIINESEHTMKRFSRKEGLAHNFNVDMLIDHTGSVWITSNEGGITVVDSRKKSLKRLPFATGLLPRGSFDLKEDKKGNIWIAGDGVYILNPEAGTVSRLWRDQGITDGNFVIGLQVDTDGKAFFGTQAGNVYAYDRVAGSLEKHTLTSAGNLPYSIHRDREGQLWVGTSGGGCFVINPNSGKPGNFTTAEGLGSTDIWSTLQTRNGNYWIGTNDGIDVVSRETGTVRHIGTEQGLHNKFANGLFEDSNGQVWAFGEGGATIFNKEVGTVQYLGKDQGIRDGNIVQIEEDKRNQFWFGSRNGDVYLWAREEKLYKRISNLPVLKGDQISFLHIDSKGQLWITSMKAGVVVVDAERKTMRQLSSNQGLASNEVTNFLEAKDGGIWLGTRLGLNRLDLVTNTLINFSTKEGLPHNEIWATAELNQTIYAGTTGGLSMITTSADSSWQIMNLGKQQGLHTIDFDMNSTSVSREGELWAGVDTQALLVMGEPKKDTLRPLTFVTGLRVLDEKLSMPDRTYTESQLRDTVWKADGSGFYESREAALDSRYKAIPWKWDSLDATYFMPINLQLPYDKNYLSFTFAGLDFSDPDKVRYRYKLEGIDKNWSGITSNAFSENYRDLPPGSYSFNVRSRGMNGLWSAPASFSFTILPPLWKTWWAYAGYFVLLGFAGWRVHLFQKAATVRKERERTRDRELAQAKEIEKAYNDLKATQSQLIQSEKMASLGELTAGIAHEIQNPLNFVNNFAEVNRELLQEMKEEIEKGNIGEVKSLAGNIVDNEEKILFHGKRADSIVKGMLQHSRASSGVKEPTDINALADEYLRLAYHGLRAKDKSFNAVMKTDLDPGLEKVNVVPQDLGRVILNLITNGFYAVAEKKKSLMNGFEPTVTVITRKSGDQVKITVQDNGNGIPQNILDKIFQPFFTTKPSGQGTGLGLSMSYDIVTKVHGGKIDVQTRPGEGTSFILTIPNKSS